MKSRCLVGLLVVAMLGCRDRSAAPAPPAAREVRQAEAARTVAAKACDLPELALRRGAPARVVAIGDLHGDLGAARAALRLAGAIDEEDRWIGGDELLIVQTGDLLDRGDDEPELMALFDRIPAVTLNGNHELMNVAGDLRYVTPGGFEDYGGEAARSAAFSPGGREAARLAERNLVAIVGDTVFAHGGVLPEHVERGLGVLNRETRCWLAGASSQVPQAVRSPRSPVWTRAYGYSPAPCALVAEVLSALGAARMVVGHTVQRGHITSDCDGRLWRIDVGMAAHYGGSVQVLELTADGARVLPGAPVRPADTRPARNAEDEPR